MGQSKRRKRVKKFNYDKNRKMQWRRSKEGIKIGCPQIKAVWDDKKSVHKNLEEMGLSADPNKSIQKMNWKKKQKQSEVARLSKIGVIEELETEANAPQEPGLILSEPEVQFCTYMLEKHGDDYKAMAKDRKNHYQNTPKQIRKRILTFKGIPAHYQAYLAAKEQTMDTA